MEQMWNILKTHKLSPNQFYVMYSMITKVVPPYVNVPMELRNLKNMGWLNDKGELSSAGRAVVKEVEGFFKKRKKKTSKSLMGDEFEENIKAYNEQFPRMKLPTGKLARSYMRNLEPAFRWFFENHDYSWEVIEQATTQYIKEKRNADWAYCRNSMYFVRKQATDKTWASELADYCQMIEDGVDPLNDDHFTEKVF